MKRITLSIGAVAMAVLLITIGILGCASEKATSIMVYSGAGMRKPMDEIAVAFQGKYGVQVTYNYAGSNALLSQMELTKEGDAYMPGETMYIEIAK